MNRKRGIEIGLLIVLVVVLLPIVVAPNYPLQTCDIQIARGTPENFVQGNIGAPDIVGTSDGWTNVHHSSTCGIGCKDDNGNLRDVCAPDAEDYFITLHKDVETGSKSCGSCASDFVGPIYQGKIVQGKNNWAGEREIGGINPEWAVYGPFDFSSSPEWIVTLYGQFINNVNFPSGTCGYNSAERSLGTSRITIRPGQSTSEIRADIDGMNFRFEYGGGNTFRTAGYRYAGSSECHLYGAKFVIVPSTSGMCFEGNKISSCKIPTNFNPEEYENRCAASVDNDLDGKADITGEADSRRPISDIPVVAADSWLDLADVPYKCCGNYQDGREDNGNLYLEADRLCTRRNDGIEGDWKWISPDASGTPFKVYTIDRGDDKHKYSAISNSDGWFFCATSEPTIEQDECHLVNGQEVCSKLQVSTMAGLGNTGAHVLTAREGLSLPSERIGQIGSGGVTTGSGTGGGMTGSIGGSRPVINRGSQIGAGGDTDGDGFFADISLSPENRDCDDDPRDDPTGCESVLGCAQFIHPGAYDPCGDGIDQACNDVNGEVCDTQITQITSDKARAARFMCSNEDAVGSFAECCNGLSCTNAAPIARTQGAVLTSIKEFYEGCDVSDNCVLTWPMFGSEQREYYSHYIFTDHSVNLDRLYLSDAEITDWRNYDYLEFYIEMANNFIGEVRFLGPRIRGDGSREGDYIDNIFTGQIKDYVVNSPALGEWMHIKIPLSAIEGLQEINGILFRAKKSEVQDFGHPFAFQGRNDAFNVVRLDRVFLSKAGEDRWCSGSHYVQTSFENLWLSDLDNNNRGADNQPVGRFACEATAGYAWTGTQCCGDDAGSTTDTYADTYGGCLLGDPVRGNSRASFIGYTVDGRGRNYLCTEELCEYPVPGAVTQPAVVNYTPNSVYDLLYVDGSGIVQEDVSRLSTPPSYSGLLRADNVAQQLLFREGAFWGCQPAPINQFNGLVEKGMCEVTGDFFCSGPVGDIEAPHWSDEDSGSALAHQRSVNHTVPGPERDYPFFFPDVQGDSFQGCCSQNTCWDGGKCVDSLPFNVPLTQELLLAEPEHFALEIPVVRDRSADQYACLKQGGANSTWQNVFYREKFDSTDFGYCLQDQQCWDGQRCVGDGSIIGDNFCDTGNWTSRTKFLGEKFLAMVGGSDNYVLYCDSFENVLNHFEYNIANDIPVEAFLDSGANNICVVRFNDVHDSNKEKVVIGTSLNSPVNVNLQTFVDVLNDAQGSEVYNCRDAFDSNQNIFKQCNNDQHLWYHGRHGLIVYTKDGAGLFAFESLNGRDLFLSLIRYPIETLTARIAEVIKPIFGFGVPLNSKFFDKLSDFSRVYIAENKTKTVLGVQEFLDDQNEFMSVEYQGFGADLCSRFDGLFIDCAVTFDPGEATPRYVLFGFDERGFDLWPDATAKLRLHERVLVPAVPTAVIIEPGVLDAANSPYTSTGKIILNAREDPNVQSYYWDIDPGTVLNSGPRLQGAHVVANLDTVGAGYKKVTLITVGKDGKTARDDAVYCVNDPAAPNNDGDSLQDGCDPDDDNDGICDFSFDGFSVQGCTSGPDNCPFVPNGPALGTCLEGTGTTCSTNDDCPESRCIKTQETVADGRGVVCSDDRDFDGVPNRFDAYPDDTAVSRNTDKDFVNGDAKPDDFNENCPDKHLNGSVVFDENNAFVVHPCTQDDSTSNPPWRDCNGNDNSVDCLDEDDDADGLADDHPIERDRCQLIPDCDGDGLLDNEVTLYGSSPLVIDTDGDGLTDFEEVRGCRLSGGAVVSCSSITFAATSPVLSDSDGDSDFNGDGSNDVALNDKEELDLSSNPRNKDSDGDGLTDGWEMFYFGGPKVASATEDPDSDGLTNLQEFQSSTDPTNADSDSDGYPDGIDVSPLSQTQIFMNGVFPKAGTTEYAIPELLINISAESFGYKTVGICKYSSSNVDFTRMVSEFIPRGQNFAAVASLQPGQNTIYIHCEDSLGIVSKVPLVMRFTYDTVPHVVKKTGPHIAQSMNPTILIETERSAVCHFNESLQFDFEMGETLRSSNLGKKHEFIVNITEEVQNRVAVCRSDPVSEFSPPNHPDRLLSCEATGLNDAALCNGISSTSMKRNCKSDVHMTLALRTRTVAECAAIHNEASSPNDGEQAIEGLCKDLVQHTSFPKSPASLCAGHPESTHSRCLDYVNLMNALNEGVSYCTQVFAIDCREAVEHQKKSCLPKYCFNSVYNHEYNYGVICRDEYGRTVSDAIKFNLGSQLVIPS